MDTTSLFEGTGLNGDEIEVAQATYDLLSASFQTTLNPKTEPPDFTSFVICKDYVSIRPDFLLDISQDKKKVLITFTQAEYIISVGRNSRYGGCVYQSWGYAYLPKDYGHIVIKPETLLDKVQDFFQPMELDFEFDPEFSRRFYVLTEDAMRARSCMNDAFRKVFLEFAPDNFVLEISHHTLLMGIQKKINPEETLEMAEFLNKISTLQE